MSEEKHIVDEPPPSYDSLYGRIKKAKVESDSNVGFARTVATLLFTSVGCTICLILILAVPVANIVIGALYLDKCPIQRYIPIYMIVSGAVGIVYNVFGILKKMAKRSEDEDTEERPGTFTSVCSCVFGCFLFAWFIAGNVWIYSIYDEWSSDPASGIKYCHPTCYLFAFWTTTLVYILMGASIFFGCCSACIAACLGCCKD
ncbi:transmembrane protein 272-like isoform X1 [Ostrea edulis]|uniref:transmembrane protein 272-like isoform X1 n=1 Tax=Ostrea edulis TaxID=37623 RepID=UPI0024AF48D8|nr:transmembrane protein 272-like isoform X1 [Ostrea edulis]